MSFYGKDFDHNGRVDAYDYYIFNEVTGGGDSGSGGGSGGSGCGGEGLSLILRALIILQIFIWICRLIG